jgi:hypothetical protein
MTLCHALIIFAFYSPNEAIVLRGAEKANGYVLAAIAVSLEYGMRSPT